MRNNPASMFPIKSRTLSGITDLTLLAPVKRGLIDALDSRSYASRAGLVMRTLNSLRLSSREVERTPLVADLVDRVQAIHSFRVALVGAEPKQILLNVVFDGGWEPYMRVIWRDLGPLLDLVFCNAEGYPLAARSAFADYAAWVRSAQIETHFFYTAAPVTVGDLHYLRKREHERVMGCPMPDPPKARTLGDLLGEAKPALVALYRLSDMHPPGGADIDADDGGCLWRAARRLLGGELEPVPDEVHLHGAGQGPVGLCDARHATPAAIEAAKGACASASERAALEWFYTKPLPGPEAQPVAESDWASQAQAGIIKAHPGITHGCLLLIALRDAAAGRELLTYLMTNRRVRRADESRSSPWQKPAAPSFNVAFTPRGLQLLGVPDGTLAMLPQEFGEGMAARAGILGDIDANHPTRWRLPTDNWSTDSRPASGRPIELANVHAVVQIQAARTASATWDEFPDNTDHPLHAAVTDFASVLADQGVRILSVQAMQRFAEAAVNATTTVGALGFVDGISQPRLESPDEKDRDLVKVGDLLLGHGSSLDDKPALQGRLWDNGCFLVVRKLRQDRAAFEQAAQSADATADLAKTALMGRAPDGEAPIEPGQPTVAGNAFDFDQDPHGIACPFASHIRRANPRTKPQPRLRSIPRILRRGMSWGPRDGKGDSGLVFMAYGASIAEQFEVIQGWLAGGNSSGPGLYSGQRDPLLGMPRPGDPRRYSFKTASGLIYTTPLPEVTPFVTLDWGLYLFVPSVPALEDLRKLADEADRLETADQDSGAGREHQRRLREARSAVALKGSAILARLRKAEQTMTQDEVRDQWKIALEDLGARMSGTSEAIWAAVISAHGGALRTPYGVLVAAPELVRQVLCDDVGLSVEGYNDRLGKSFGRIYLGMDNRSPPNDYTRLSGPVNRALMGIGVDEAFRVAYDATRRVVHDHAAQGQGPEVRAEVRDLVDAMLAEVCVQWFGIPDGTFVHAGGWHWSPDATCPGHFGAPSRYTFQPHPGKKVVAVGESHGQLLRTQVRHWIDALPAGGPRPNLLNAVLAAGKDPDEQARTLIGIMMGFLPTVDGNLRGALWEWVDDRSLWQLQTELLDAAHGVDPSKAAAMLGPAQAALSDALARTLHLRPVPELVWRTALQDVPLGSSGVTVRPGERVVVSLVAAMQQRRAEGDLDLSFLFGGDRSGGSLHGDLRVTPTKATPAFDWARATHACPGSRMAWGVMLGFLAGLLGAARLRPTLTPATLKLQSWPPTATPASDPPAPGASPSSAA